MVLDPFVGSGTTCRVAKALARRWIGIDLNPEYIANSQKRIDSEFKGFDSIDPLANRQPKDMPADKTHELLFQS